MSRKSAGKKTARHPNAKLSGEKLNQSIVIRQINEIRKKKKIELRKHIQITKQTAKGRPIEDFPRSIGIRDLEGGFWTARIKVQGIELLIEPISEKEPLLVRTLEGNVVRLSKKAGKELNNLLYKMFYKRRGYAENVVV